MIVCPRRSLLAIALLTTAFSVAACSTTTSEVGATATSGVGDATIGVETSDLYVGIINTAGRPIERVRITIQVVGTSPPFTTTISRMESGERRELSPATFRANDGTTFSPRLHRARQISVSAEDIVGKKLEVTKPWKR